jgi:hypothetical protein
MHASQHDIIKTSVNSVEISMERLDLLKDTAEISTELLRLTAAYFVTLNFITGKFMYYIALERCFQITG